MSNKFPKELFSIDNNVIVKYVLINQFEKFAHYFAEHKDEGPFGPALDYIFFTDIIFNNIEYKGEEKKYYTDLYFLKRLGYNIIESEEKR